jgi:F1F0 ATPase subunit 2
MSEHPMAWLLAIGGGGLVAVVYFASLWWTVRRLPRSWYPGLLVAGSYLLRAPLAALALFGVAAGDALRMCAAAVAFLVVRVLLTRALRRGAVPAPAPTGAGALSGER